MSPQGSQYAKGHKYLTLVYQIDQGITHLLGIVLAGGLAAILWKCFATLPRLRDQRIASGKFEWRSGLFARQVM